MELLTLVAAVITVTGTCFGIVRWVWRRSKSPEMVQPHTGLPFWDVTVTCSDQTSESVALARLTVVGETNVEAAHRARQLVEEWNQVSLGFEVLTGKTIPKDDEGKPLNIVRPELLPQSDGDQVPLTVIPVKRQLPGFPGFSLIKRVFRRD